MIFNRVAISRAKSAWLLGKSLGLEYEGSDSLGFLGLAEEIEAITRF